VIYAILKDPFSMSRQLVVSKGPAHRRGCTITLRHTTLGRKPLDEWQASLSDLYLTHSAHKSGIQTLNPSKRAAADPRLTL